MPFVLVLWVLKNSVLVSHKINVGCRMSRVFPGHKNTNFQYADFHSFTVGKHTHKSWTSIKQQLTQRSRSRRGICAKDEECTFSISLSISISLSLSLSLSLFYCVSARIWVMVSQILFLQFYFVPPTSHFIYVAGNLYPSLHCLPICYVVFLLASSSKDSS
jgi:hypothetical protein